MPKCCLEDFRRWDQSKALSTRLVMGHLDIVEDAGATLIALGAQIWRMWTSRNTSRIISRSRSR
ncbi:hypothetical protein Trco_008146 [Trichoderma cornu-damae]|uniref:Uncharacterized protein n=1 Tax=Trichoderma cornu-damae TaxID=654480 RepID=A0A9P8QDV8_9HYPO|nr:hypothetical protein Trco_008146 [Trichoderma cornu-damae]